MKILITLFACWYSNIVFGQAFYAGENSGFDLENKSSAVKWKKNSGFYLQQEKEVQQHFYNLTEPAVFVLQDWWVSEINSLKFCPNKDFKRNIEYTRYLFRILTLSYITEFLKVAYRATKKLDCSFNYKDIFNKCKPNSKDMKTYLYRLKLSYSRFVDDTESSNLANFKNKFCEGGVCENNINCLQIKELANNICNERDNIYGQSDNVNLYHILKKSSALTGNDSLSLSSACLNRFIRHFKNRELRDDYLNILYSYIYNTLRKSNARYIEGLNFVPGALKEFDSKGLSDFLLSLPKPKKVHVTIINPNKSKIKKVMIKPVKRLPKKKNEIVKLKKIIPPPKKRKSAFEKARFMLTKYKLRKSMVDLDKFKNEFSLSEKEISKYDKKLKKFVTRKMLAQMKKHEKLGSKSAPVPLVFIDYLLIISDHQSLWNLVSVLGNEFYVFNNLENTKGSVLIRLDNNTKTKYKWQMLIIGK